MWSAVELYISSYPKYIKVQRFKSRTTVLHIFFLCKPATFLLPRVKHGKPFFILSLRDIYNFIQKQIRVLTISITANHHLLAHPLTTSLLLPSLPSHCSTDCLLTAALTILSLLQSLPHRNFTPCPFAAHLACPSMHHCLPPSCRLTAHWLLHLFCPHYYILSTFSTH